MTNATTARPVAGIPRLSRATDAREVALGVYERLFDLLASLDAADWDVVVPDCPDWTVADMVGHLLGAARAQASVREQLRQLRHGRRHKGEFDGNELDAANDLQVRDHAGLAPGERLATLRALAPKAVAGRMRLPAPLRKLNIPMSQGGSVVPSMPTRLNLGNLVDAILTRDVWMHRCDVARALGRPIDVDSDLDRRVVADAVAEWAATHRQPFLLVLTGPAGGAFRQPGEDGTELELDAVEFCRILSGRAPAEGLLSTRILF